MQQWWPLAPDMLYTAQNWNKQHTMIQATQSVRQQYAAYKHDNMFSYLLMLFLCKDCYMWILSMHGTVAVAIRCIYIEHTPHTMLEAAVLMAKSMQ